MADSPSTGISILQILSVPALLAVITGVGSFLKSLWDKWSEQRSLIGLQRLTDYLDLDNKRDTPLLTRQTRGLIGYEINLKLREFAGTPADEAVEKVERWRRRPYLIRAMWIPSEIRKPLVLTLGLQKGSTIKPSKNFRINGEALRRMVVFYAISISISVLSYLFSLYAERMIVAQGIVLKVPGKVPGNAVPFSKQYSLYYYLVLVVIGATLVVFFGLTASLADADRRAWEFVKKKREQEMTCDIDDC